jgi:CRP-like cAMP-binding protein
MDGGARTRGQIEFDGNRLLRAMSRSDRELLRPHLQAVTLRQGAVLIEAGEDVTRCYFPCDGTIAALVVALPDGTMTETATVGREGAIGGIVSLGQKPAFARAVVQVGGNAFWVDSERLEACKDASGTFRDLISRYADCLLAQVLQSVACNALHSLEPRFCRWLLHVHDRAGGSDVPLTQEVLAEMLGVQRTTVTAVAAALHAKGLIQTGRGRIAVIDRPGIESIACACHGAVVEHFERLLPGVYPRAVQPPASRKTVAG